MVQDSLVRYIREQIRAGYDIGTIKNYLIKYGYPESRVNEAMQYAYPPSEVKHVVHLSKTTVALAVAVICTLLLAAIGIFYFNSSPSKLLDVSTSLLSNSINPGDNLQFTVELSNLGKAKRYDVMLRYEVRNQRDELLTFKEETIAVETKASTSVSIILGNAEPGNYYLKAIASYGDEKATATSSFSINAVQQQAAPEPAPAARSCPFSCNDNNQCTNDYCSEATNYECGHDNVIPCCGNGACEIGETYQTCISDCAAPASVDIFEGKPIWEKIDIIKGIAKNDKQKALGYCNDIEQTGYNYDCLTGVAASANDDNVCNDIADESYKDNCYKTTATANMRSDVCAKVVKDSKRDQCYMDFATKGDYSICNKLVNKYLAQSCDSLRKLSEMNAPS